MQNKTFRPRDTTIVNFVIRYRLATNNAVRLRLVPGRSPNAVAKVTARLCTIGLLTRYMLIPPETYFRVGVKAINALGLSPRDAEALGPQALPVDYATLVYATQGESPKQRLSTLDFTEYTPWLPEEMRRSPYCLAADGRLDLVRVDLGGSPQHVARKVAIAAHDRLSVPQLAELAARARFQIVVLTTSHRKANFIAKALADTDCADAVRIHLAVIPRLSLLLLRGN